MASATKTLQTPVQTPKYNNLRASLVCRKLACDGCNLPHRVENITSHLPLAYKTSECKNAKPCPYGEKCFFLHEEDRQGTFFWNGGTYEFIQTNDTHWCIKQSNKTWIVLYQEEFEQFYPGALFTGWRDEAPLEETPPDESSPEWGTPEPDPEWGDVSPVGWGEEAGFLPSPETLAEGPTETDDPTEETPSEFLESRLGEGQYHTTDLPEDYEEPDYTQLEALAVS